MYLDKKDGRGGATKDFEVLHISLFMKVYVRQECRLPGHNAFLADMGKNHTPTHKAKWYFELLNLKVNNKF